MFDTCKLQRHFRSYELEKFSYKPAEKVADRGQVMKEWSGIFVCPE